MRKIRLGGQQVILFGESGADNPCGWRGNSVLAESMVGRDGPRKRCSTGQLDVLCGQYNQTCCACDAKEMRAEFWPTLLQLAEIVGHVDGVLLQRT
jgi:hypothetical protein